MSQLLGGEVERQSKARQTSQLHPDHCDIAGYQYVHVHQRRQCKAKAHQHNYTYRKTLFSTYTCSTVASAQSSGLWTSRWLQGILGKYVGVSARLFRTALFCIDNLKWLIKTHEQNTPCDAKRKKMWSSGQLFQACWPSSAEHTTTSLSGTKSSHEKTCL